MRVGIVGAGISGLATAFWLGRARPDWQLTVIEAAATAGGALDTAVIDGFRFEAGCNGFLTNKPDGLELVAAVGASDLLLESAPAARRRYLYSGRLRALPESPSAFLPTPLLSVAGKLRVLGEILIPARRETGEESLQAFGYRRLGREFTDVFLDAMTAGIYGSTPAKLSVAAAFPLVEALEREHGGLFRGMLARRRRHAGPGGVLMSFRGGTGSFIARLTGQLGANLELGDPAVAIERVGARYALETQSTRREFDCLVVATPAHAAVPVLARLDPGLADAVAAIDYSPIAVVGFGYRQLAAPLDGFGLLTTTASQQPVLGVLWDASIFPDRAPPGGKILRALLGGQRSPATPSLPDERLIALARAGIRRTMGIDPEPEVVFIRRWEHGIPNYGPGHLARLAAIDGRLRAFPGLYLTGNAYRGVAMNDCCRESRALAGRIVAAAGAGATAVG